MRDSQRLNPQRAHLMGSRDGRNLIHTVHSQEVECAPRGLPWWTESYSHRSFTGGAVRDPQRVQRTYFVGSRGGRNLSHRLFTGGGVRDP